EPDIRQPGRDGSPLGCRSGILAAVGLPDSQPQPLAPGVATVSRSPASAPDVSVLAPDEDMTYSRGQRPHPMSITGASRQEGAMRTLPRRRHPVYPVSMLIACLLLLLSSAATPARAQRAAGRSS